MSRFAKDQEFMLPASNLFILLSLAAALVFNWLPLSGVWRTLRPDFVALVLLFWCIHKPYRVGIGIAWFIGVITDVGDASLFGQHALAYSVLAFGGVMLHRRTQMLDLRQQAMQVFPIILFSYAVYALVHWQLHGFITWTYFISSVMTALLWIPLSLLLQAIHLPRTDLNAL